MRDIVQMLRRKMTKMMKVRFFHRNPFGHGACQLSPATLKNRDYGIQPSEQTNAALVDLSRLHMGHKTCNLSVARGESNPVTFSGTPLHHAKAFPRYTGSTSDS